MRHKAEEKRQIPLIEVDSIHWNTKQRSDDTQILIVGINSNRTQSGGLQKDTVKVRGFNGRYWRFGNDKDSNKQIDADSKRFEMIKEVYATTRGRLEKNWTRRAHNLLRSIEYE